MVVSEIGMNHLGSEKLYVFLIKKINQLPVDAITVQLFDEDFFQKNNITNYFIKKEKLIYTIIKYSKKKVGFVVDNLDCLILKQINKC